MKRGTLLSLSGLLLGLLLGCAILALKRYAAHELMGVLEDEVKKSCPCALVYDSVDISLLTLSAKARNVRIIENNQDRLFFKKAEADFSLQKIFGRKIILSELRLSEGHSDGVGPESTTFRFIDSLAAPIPPERDRPDRWKLKLQKLKLLNSSFSEKFTHSEIIGKGASLELERTPSNDFILSPSIDSTSLIRYPHDDLPVKEEIPLGQINAELFLDDDFIEMKHIAIRRAKSRISVQAISHTNQGNALEGKIDYSIDARSLDFPEWFNASMAGQAKLSGTFAEPNLQGELHNREGSIVSISRFDPLPLSFSSLNAAYQFGVRSDLPEITVQDLEASGVDLSVLLRSAFSLKAGKMAGTFQIRADNLLLNGISFAGLSAMLELDGLIDSPQLNLNGHTNLLAVEGQDLGPLDFQINFANQSLRLDLATPPDRSGRFAAEGQVTLGNSQKADNLDRFTFNLQDFPITPVNSESGQAFLKLHGKGSLSGALGLKSLNGDASLSLSAPTLVGPTPLSLNLTYRSGKIEGALQNDDKSLFSSFQYQLGAAAPATIALEMLNYKPLLAFSTLPQAEIDCTRLNAKAQYSFPIESPSAGQGSIELADFTFGCPPYQMLLSQPTTISIKDRSVSAPQIVFQGPDSTLTVKGGISRANGYHVSAEGVVELKALLQLLPPVDDARGQLAVFAQVNGPFTNPLISGSAEIRDAGFDIESVDMSARAINARLDLQGEKIVITQSSGRLNGGEFSLSGAFAPSKPRDSLIGMEFRQVALNPAENLSILTSGTLHFTPEESKPPLISGEVKMDNAEYRMNIDLASLLRSLSQSMLSRSPQALAQNARAPRSPIDLDITLSAPGNLFLSTTFAEAELKAGATILGNSNTPLISGKVEAVSGRFGLKDRSFEITAGTVTLTPGNSDPSIEIVGESSVRSREGDNILVLIEVSGTLSNPKVSFSSDRGLSDRELLNLITSSSDLTSQSRVNTIGQNIELDVLPFIDENSFLGLGKFFKRLTRIDSISLEPTFNSQRGVVEPSVVAKKNITDKVYAIGESSFGGSGTDSRARLIYEIHPKLKIAGIVNSESDKRQTALGADLTYTILAEQRKFLEVQISGNDAFENSEILGTLKLTDSSRVKPGDLEKLKGRTESFYRTRGYFQSEINLSCETSDPIHNDYCRHIDMTVKEGPQYKVCSVYFEGDTLPEAVKADRLIPEFMREIASEDLLQSIVRTCISRLRSEGYIGARIEAQYVEASDKAKGQSCMDAHIKVYTGEPQTFVFVGNSKFTPSDFLNSINLFERKQPFGVNTINILLENIERMYREAGYLFVQLGYGRALDLETKRVTYEIHIDEGTEIRVVKVKFEGNQSLSIKRLRRLVRNRALHDFSEIFSPKYAVNEQLENNANILREIYIEDGFPDAQIEPHILPNDEKHTAIILYEINEGAPDRVQGIHINQFPADSTPPIAPKAPYSIPKANQYLQQLENTLIDEGYLFPSLSSRMDTGGSELVIDVDAGSRTIIGKIIVEGNVNIPQSTIEKNLLLHSGDPWRNEVVQTSRKKLLKLGLFNRVEIIPNDGTLDNATEDVLIRVSERPLQSLEVGGGVDSEYGLHVFGLATDRSLFSDGRSLSLRLDAYYDSVSTSVSQGVASLTFANPSLLSSEYGLISDVRYQRLDQTTLEYNLDRVSLSTFLHRSFPFDITASTGYSMLFDNLNDVSPDAVLSSLDTGNVRLGFLSAVVNYDKRDDPLNPRRGFNIGTDAQISGSALGSQGDFISTGIKGSYLYPLPIKDERFTLALSGRTASAWAFEGTEYVPITQRYYLGGRNSVRGFRENSLGPRGDEGSVLGGDLLLAENFEFRYLIADSTSVHLFLDAGTVFLKKQSVDLGDIRSSSGFGLRYLSPIGPIGFDVGFPLDRENGESSYQIHFNIGSNF